MKDVQGSINAGIRGLARGFLVLFLALFAYVGYLQTIGSSAIASREENARSALEESQAPRGKITARDGEVLAESVPLAEGGFGRRYPQRELTAHIVGYVSKRYGRTGIEARENNVLSGIGGGRFFDRLVRAASGTQEKGRDIALTLDLDLQRAAARSLRGKEGAAVIIDVRTGEVLAAYSNPTFDPSDIDRDFSRLSKDSDSPLLSRATQGLYPPGSTMKVITAAASLRDEAVGLGSILEGPKELVVQGNRVTNYRDQTCGELDLINAFAKSCNTIFARLGLDLGNSKMKAMAEDFGFNKRPGIETPAYASRYPEPKSRVDLAWSSVGQAEVLATPLQMALVAATVAGDGVQPSPRIIKRDLRVPGTGRRVISSQIAGDMRIMMEAVTKRGGTGRAAAVGDMAVGGKTGTAEVARGRSHAWFIGYAPAQNPRYAVAVIVEHGGTGGSVAAPIAGRLLQAATRIQP